MLGEGEARNRKVQITRFHFYKIIKHVKLNNVSFKHTYRMVKLSKARNC